ncbi:MAG: hypothetical protein GTN99_08080 [Candidatus Dadabacteria bacterium]|nr:hypothetical protein [Candidatus Dadabacteria bacterium]
MALDPSFSTGFRNALLDGTDVTTMFDNGELRIHSGTKPADADATEGAGTVLATVTLPVSNAFAASASSGAIAKAGTWQDTSADATGTAAWFRLYASPVTTGASTTSIRIDGTVGVGASFDLDITSTAITATDPVTVDTFSISIAIT